MKITNIELINFRNYKKLNLSIDSNINLILGNNAQGKTNLIESIYLSSMGKSFRTNKDSEMINFDEDFSKIKIDIEKEYIDTTVEIILKKSGKKSIKKDGVNIKKTSELLENVVIVIFSPEDLKLVKDEPDKRRKFIDRELSQISPSYYDSISNYKKVLLQRNSYLKEIEIDSNILDLWNVQLARYGAQVIHGRYNFIKKISKISGNIHSEITDSKEFLKLRYNANVDYIDNISELEKSLYERIKKSEKNDIRQRSTTVGPHKDDMEFWVNEINMRNFGSQGQQRTTALSLKLAELTLIREEIGEEAILLLDDVMSELDANRQEFLIRSLRKNQIFITSAEIDSNIKEKFKDCYEINIKQGMII